MLVAVHTAFAASKKEPLVVLLNRVHQAFLDNRLGEPTLRFTFSDAPLPGYVSSVNRVLKRQPEMERFLATDSPMAGIPETRRLTNAASREQAAFPSIQAIAGGVPRSFPFHGAAIHLHAPAFGEMVLGVAHVGSSIAGVMLTDNWWVNGRNRTLSAVTLVDADPGSKKLPALPEPVAAVLAVFGRAKRTEQIPLTPAEPQSQPATASANPESANAVRTVIADYRGRIKEIVERAALPHDLPPESQVRRESLGVVAGPLKPVLLRVFKPLGYTCRCESGTFTLRRRTEANLTAQLYLDVGTWSRQVTAVFQVLGVGFKANLPIPVAASAIGTMQYPIGDAERWRKIVENLAALVAELNRTLVPEIERAAGPTPEWYLPEA